MKTQLLIAELTELRNESVRITNRIDAIIKELAAEETTPEVVEEITPEDTTDQEAEELAQKLEEDRLNNLYTQNPAKFKLHHVSEKGRDIFTPVDHYSTVLVKAYRLLFASSEDKKIQVYYGNIPAILVDRQLTGLEYTNLRLPSLIGVNTAVVLDG